MGILKRCFPLPNVTNESAAILVFLYFKYFGINHGINHPLYIFEVR